MSHIFQHGMVYEFNCNLRNGNTGHGQPGVSTFVYALAELVDDKQSYARAHDAQSNHSHDLRRVSTELVS